MCFNKEVSFLVFLFGFLTSIKLFICDNQKSIELGLIILTISLMQLNEFFIWKYNKNRTLNKFFSSFVPIVVLIQIIVPFYLIIKHKHLEKDDNFFWPYCVFFGIFVICSIYILFNVISGPNPSYRNKSTCRLKWGAYSFIPSLSFVSILYSVSYLIVLLSSFYYIDWKLLLLSALTLVLSVMYYRKFNIGSIWCFSAIILVIFTSIFNLFDETNSSTI